MQVASPKLNITVSRGTTMNSRRVIVEFGKDDLETLLANGIVVTSLQHFST